MRCKQINTFRWLPNSVFEKNQIQDRHRLFFSRHFSNHIWFVMSKKTPFFFLRRWWIIYFDKIRHLKFVLIGIGGGHRVTKVKPSEDKKCTMYQDPNNNACFLNACTFLNIKLPWCVVCALISRPKAVSRAVHAKLLKKNAREIISLVCMHTHTFVCT